MSKRRGTQHRRTKRHQRRGLLDGPTPEGFVVFTDRDGKDRLLYAPEMRAALREHCDLCDGEGSHQWPGK